MQQHNALSFPVSRLAMSIALAITLSACNGGGGGSSGNSNAEKNFHTNSTPPSYITTTKETKNTLETDHNTTTKQPRVNLPKDNPPKDPDITHNTIEDVFSSNTEETKTAGFVETSVTENIPSPSLPSLNTDYHNPFSNTGAEKNTIPQSAVNDWLTAGEKNKLINQEIYNTNHQKTYRLPKNTANQYDGIKKYSTHSANTSIVVNEKTKWTKEQLEQAFKWDRLERDFEKPKDIITFLNGIDYDLSSLKDKINENLAKIAILDTTMTKNADLYQDRLKSVDYILSKSQTLNLTGGLGHGDKVASVLIGKPNNAFIEKYHLNNYDYRLGFLSEKGSIAFLGFQKNNSKYSSFTSLISSNKLKDLIQQGYNILNISLSNSFTKQSLELAKNNPLVTRLEQQIKLLNQYSKENDILTVISLGNQANRQVSAFNYASLTFKDKYPDYYNAQLSVGAYDPESASGARYTNHCNDTKETCIFALGTTLVYKNSEYLKYRPEGSAISEFEKSYGTSFAAPYVAGTLALVRSVFPFMNNYNVQQTVLTTAQDLGTPGIDDKYGWGLIQPLSAIRGPKQFYKSDFIVNLSHNENYQTNNEIYRFSNDISGNYGLKVYGNNKQNVLSLSGVNTYKGDTVLYSKAIVNIDGVITNSDIIINQNSYLYGSGWVNNVYNQGTLSNYSIFATKPNHINETRSHYGMVINGDYIQDEAGKLNVLLGQPLLIKGNATLAGTLNITGFKKIFVNHNTLIGDALVAQGDLKGTFEHFTSIPLLETNTINTEKINVDNKTINVISVTATYAGAINKLNEFISPKEETYSIAKTGAENLDALHRSVSNSPRTEHLARAASSDETDQENNYSPLTTLIAEIQAEPNKDSIKNSYFSLSGNEFINAYQQNQRLVNFTNQKNRENLLTNNTQGFQLGYTYSQLFGKNKNNIQLNQLNLNYLSSNNISLLLGLNTANISNQEAVSNADNSGKSKAINLAISYPLLDKLNLNYQFSYSDLKGKLDRQGNLDNQSYTYQHNYHYQSLSNEFFISHKLTLTPKQWFTPYYGLSFTTTKMNKINETHTGNFNLVLDQQTKNSKAWFAGLIYQYQNPFDLRNTHFYLAYQLSKTFNTNNQLKGYLQDDTLISPLKFYNRDSKKLVQNLNLTLETKLTKKITFNGSFNTNLKQEKGFNLGISYQF
ncbi:hypothetical protein CEP48_04135 [Mergibacter septicus]|uniref:Uncharacterized protein n=1 Tax=Mergibacter septicus TaxID=221402 RepID=A0A8E3SCY5_9PAST|nr:S8 family serine peptidase [Mergibacter septicus]AWX15408.1 hypothetical protein CEP47_04140 [Mergibacter septicus]QDJ14661.1 hypothetical protein CEP48_04135 [Mergibacter septicus]UTU47907.1 S8 family serine peptidase [Mergibacter septicus]WMR96487.1 S8 family serine peptidase [Mergibacter septicus]